MKDNYRGLRVWRKGHAPTNSSGQDIPNATITQHGSDEAWVRWDGDDLAPDSMVALSDLETYGQYDSARTR